MLKARDKGLMVRTTADTIAFSPPLIVGREKIDQIVTIPGDVLNELG